MNRNYVTGALLGLLFLSALSASLLCFRYLSSMRRLGHLQARFVTIQNHRNQIQALANEALEYSKRNPAIDPLLVDMAIKPKVVFTPNTPAANQPASAPAAKKPAK